MALSWAPTPGTPKSLRPVLSSFRTEALQRLGSENQDGIPVEAAPTRQRGMLSGLDWSTDRWRFVMLQTGRSRMAVAVIRVEVFTVEGPGVRP